MDSHTQHGSDETPHTISDTAVLGSIWRRLGAYLLDGVILVCTVQAVTNKLAGLQPFLPFLQTHGTNIVVPAWLFPVQALLVIAYFALFQASRFQATPGKLALRLHVTDRQGRRMTFGQSLLRELVKQAGTIFSLLVPISAASIGSLFVLADCITLLVSRRRQSIHDMVAGTLVYRTRT